MALLFEVVFAAKCSSTHHKIALDALQHLRGDDAERWQNLFLKHHAAYLDGAKAPDTRFKDFQNHVLHVKEGYWGGAVKAAGEWYARCVSSLRSGAWPQAVFEAGVLSHYFADPHQPFHTGQTEEEGALHRPAEWSITKSYTELCELLEEELGGYPELETPDGPDWLATMIRAGATAAHPHYQTLLDHYNLELGVKRPPAGLDRTLQECLAELLGLAIVGFARVLERAFDEARAHPPAVSLALETVLAALSVPLDVVLNKLDALEERAQLKAMYEEVQLTGKAVYTLPDDDWTVRRQHAREVLKVPLAKLNLQPVKPTGRKHGGSAATSRPPKPASAPKAESGASTARKQRQDDGETRDHREHREAQRDDHRDVSAAVGPAAVPAAPTRQPPSSTPAQNSPGITPGARSNSAGTASNSKSPTPTPPASSAPPFRLELDRPVVDAPAIGAKTADRLRSAGIETVADLLLADPRALSAQLGQRWITPELIEQWQAMSELVCRIPGIHGHDAQLLVSAGFFTPDELTQLSPEEVLERVEPIVQSKEGERILRSAAPPDLKEVRQWIAHAAAARELDL